MKEQQKVKCNQCGRVLRMEKGILKEDALIIKKEWGYFPKKIWKCMNCGHIYVGQKAPEICPVCAHSQAYFEIKEENY